jgi:hypothetical protein
MYKFQDISNFGEYLYNTRLPQIYLDKDSEPEQNYALKKYLLAIGEVINLLIKDMVDLMDLYDPIKCPDIFFPLLFERFGLPFFQDIDINFQRRLLLIIGDLYMRKGTKGVIEYFGREVSGLEARLVDNNSRILRTWSTNSHPEIHNYIEPKLWAPYTETSYIFGKYFNFGTITIVLELIDSWEDGDENLINLGERIFERFLWYFLPFDIFFNVIKVMRNTEIYTGFQDNQIDDEWWNQLDLMSYEESIVTAPVEYAGIQDFANTCIWYNEGAEIRSIQSYLDESKLNHKSYVLNSTMITNLLDYVDKVIPA